MSSKLTTSSPDSILVRTLLFTAMLALGSCASNPTGGTDFVLMSERTELEKGKELHEQMLKDQQIYQNANLQAYVNKVGQRLAAISHRPELEYHFTVIDSPDINAFALPGGYVYINRGLMNFLSNESQLAAVLGHEIGHITDRHAVKQQTAGRTTNILSTAAAVASVIATGTSVLGETASLFGGALVRGYGREMELDADELGAEYLVKAGYDPNAMAEVIGVLKNHEDFMKRTSNRGPAYHGLFATHPRNDARLKEAVARGAMEAESTPVQLAIEDPAEFRRETTGMVIGPTLQNMTGDQARNRYYQTLLNYTVVLPDTWTHDETTTTLTASEPEGKASINVETVRLQQPGNPRDFVRETMKVPDLQQSEALNQFGVQGYTGIRPDTNERIAVFFYGQRAFIFTGTASDPTYNAALFDTIRSFRPIARNEGVFANPIQVTWIQADGRTTYAELARSSRIPQHSEETLRLMNGDYPSGEPEAGEWIKVAR